MGATLNRCTFIGNAGKDAELHTTASGMAVAKFSLAVNERHTDKAGTAHDSVEWINVVTWGKRAEVAGRWVTKGKQLYVEGRMRTRTYDDDKGVRRYFVEITADNIQFLGPKPAGDASPDAAEDNQPEPESGDIPF